MRNFFILFTTFFMLMQMNSFAQINLVPNGDFEVYDTCPSILPLINSTITYAIPWFQPYIPQGSTDYNNACDTTNICSVPVNWGGIQMAHSGNGYAGIICLIDLQSPTDYREYMEVELLDSLEMGHKYCVEFYVSRGEVGRYAMSNIGIYFSDSVVLYSNPFFGVLNYVPQIENLTTNLLTDTLNWTLVSADFIASGGEKFITIGSFTPKAQCTYLSIGTNPYILAYYYIDDVSVIDCSSTGIPDNNLSKDLELYPNPVKDLLTVKFGNAGSNFHNLTLSDLTGKIILHKHVSSEKEIQLDLSAYPLGMYFLMVEDGKEMVTKKIVRL